MYANNNKFVIFGASSSGIIILEQLKKDKKDVAFFLDNYTKKKNLLGYDIQSPTYENVNQYPIIIASEYFMAIAEQLEQLNCSNYIAIHPREIESIREIVELIVPWGKNIGAEYERNIDITHLNWLKKKLIDFPSKNILEGRLLYLYEKLPFIFQSTYKQYFHPAINFSSKKCILDVGAYDLETTVDFLTASPNACSYAFEIDPFNIKKSHHQLFLMHPNLQKRIHFIDTGLWDSTTTLKFSHSDKFPSAGYLDKSGEISVKVITLDEFCQQQSIVPDYIKMDIEGAEIEALKGGINTIMKHKPDLAICIYHKPNDLFEIPLLIHKMNPDYEMYLGHHSISRLETVLYCISRSDR